MRSLPFAFLLGLLLSSRVPDAVVAQTDLHVYALKASPACSGSGACPVILVALSPGSDGADRDLGTLQTAKAVTPSLTSIAMSPDNHLFASDGVRLYTVDSQCPGSTCLVTSVGSSKLTGDVITGLTFHPDGRLFGVTRGGQFLALNPKNGRPTLVHDFGVGDSSLTGAYAQGFGFEGGLAFSLGGALYATVVPCPHCSTPVAAAHDGLVTLNPDEYITASLIETDTGYTGVHGLVFVAGEEAGTSPILLGTTGPQPGSAGCASNGALLRFEPVTAPAHLSRCLSFSAFGVTANPILPPLIASVTLRDSVRPTTRQVIHVLASPVTDTRLLVTFPNGDRLVRKTITDATGQVTFSFIQQSSKITRHGNKATVRISVGSGQTETSESYPYHIPFGSIDAVVSPRDPAPNTSLTVYVHSWPHRRVLTYLLYPNNRVQTLAGQTGPGGWMTAHHRLSATVPSGPERDVVVIARLQPGPAHVSTSTSFSVREPGERLTRP